MIKPLIFAASLLSGGGLIAYSVSVQQEQRDLVQAFAVANPEVTHVVPPPRAVSITEPGPVIVESTVVEVPDVLIEARLPRHAKAATVPISVEERPTAPCSGWRELGPQYVSSSNATTGTHQVRQLCD